MIKHPYLDELFNEAYHDDLWPYDQKGYPDCEKYGFDERETFEFSTFMIGWLYERLRYFQDVASQIVDFNYHKVIVHGEELTQMECLERMCQLCREYMYTPETEFEYDESGEGIFIINMDELKAEEARKPEVARELFYILGEVYTYMWW